MIDRIGYCRLEDEFLRVSGGVCRTTGVGEQSVLSVGVIHADKSVEEQREEARRIKGDIREVCGFCEKKSTNGGPCNPSFYVARGGLITTVAVTHNPDATPELVKTDPDYLYEEI